jgi:hypothetical protein
VPRKVLTEPKGKKTDSSDLEFDKRAISSPEKVIDPGNSTETRKELESESVPSEVRTELQGKISDSSDLEIDERSFPSSEEGIDLRRLTKTRSGSESESRLRKVPTELKGNKPSSEIDYYKEVREELGFDEEGNMQYPSFPEDSDQEYEEGVEAQGEQEGDYDLLFGPEEKKEPQKRGVSENHVERNPRGVRGNPSQERKRKRRDEKPMPAKYPSLVKNPAFGIAGDNRRYITQDEADKLDEHEDWEVTRGDLERYIRARDELYKEKQKRKRD